MKLHYYPETDSAYIEFREVGGKKTIEVVDGVNIDLGAHDEIIGIELEHASKHLSQSVLNDAKKEKDIDGQVH